MGRLVLEEIAAAPDLEVAWTAGRVLPDPLPPADVVVDFSVPDGLRALLHRATIPVVSGTTGVVVRDVRVPLVHAANFSLGVAVLARLVQAATHALPGWDVEVVELHHSAKRDAPSGTALRLVDALGPGRVGRDGARVPGEVGLHAVRGGDVVGEHTVYLFGRGERIALTHIATDRRLFALGALTAARWVVGRPPGLYTVEDVLGG